MKSLKENMGVSIPSNSVRSSDKKFRVTYFIMKAEVFRRTNTSTAFFSFTFYFFYFNAREISTSKTPCMTSSRLIM